MIAGLSELNQDKIAILIDRRKKVLEQKDRRGRPTRFARRAAKRIDARIGEILARGMNVV